MAKLFGYDDINRAEQYRAALGGIENVTKLTTEKKKELHEVVEDALASYTALGDRPRPALQDILRATTELIPVTKSFSAANSGMWAAFAVGIEDGKQQMAEIADAAKLSWEDIGGMSRAMLEQIATRRGRKVLRRPGTQRSLHRRSRWRTSGRPPPKRRAAVDNWGTATLEAYDSIAAASSETANVQIANAQRASAATVTSWHEAMSAVAAGQGTMGGTVGGAIDTGPVARASIQKAYDEGRYLRPGRERVRREPARHGPELGRARLSGQWRPGHRRPALHGRRARAGTVRATRIRERPRERRRRLTVNNTIIVTGGTETLARQVADEIMRTIRAGTQLGTA